MPELTKIMDEIIKLNTKADHLTNQIDNIKDDLTTVKHLLTGNGNPSSGVIVRLDRVEQDHKKTSWLVKTALGAALTACIGTGAHLFFAQQKTIEKDMPPTSRNVKIVNT